MTESLYLPRLNVELFHDSLRSVSSGQIWRVCTRSATIEACERRSSNGKVTLRTLVMTCYGNHGIVAVRRASGVEWAEAEHHLVAWISARPWLHGWMSCLVAETEIAA